ncbi:MAG: AraC family transcriptional regulator [Flavobacteriales bacterium]|jgi:AraC family transcriptional regulator
MKKPITLSDYRERIMRVIDYIWQNTDSTIDVNQLADVAHFSPYHFHRIYREMMHENVNATVRRLRLSRASNLLLQTDLSLEHIAKSVNYSSGEAFSRAFSKAYELSPSAYRLQRREFHSRSMQLSATPLPVTHLPDTQLPAKRSYPMSHPVEIRDIKKTALGGLPHKGDYMAIGACFEKVFMKAGALNLLGPTTRSFGIFYDDPESLAPEKLSSHAALNLNPEQAAAADLEPLSVGGGKHAVLTFTGPYSELGLAYQWFYGHWLPNSGYECGDSPPFEEYLNNPKDTAPQDLMTDIHLALRE